jgi:integrase
MTGAEAGVILSRSRRRYKPSALRSYRQAPELRVLPDFGAHPLADLRRAEWQRFVNRLHAAGNAASTIRNTLDPVRAVYRWLQSLDEIQVNPTRGLEFPAGSRRRDRVAAPAEGAALLAALTFPEKGIYATAMYAGARRGELQALEDKNVDLDSNEMRVEWGWDEQAGRVAVKTEAAERTLPIPKVLGPILLEHRMRRGWETACCSSEGSPIGRSCRRRSAQHARDAWEAQDPPLRPIGYISLDDAACVCSGGAR